MVSKSLPPVTIGIPFHNAEPFLLDAIRSVFAQTHEDWELILMDDGSSDRSLEIARSISDPRVRVFSDGENRRLAARLNEIHSLAKYDFVARMDADDMMASDRIEKQVTFLHERSSCDLVTTGVCSITDGSVPYGIRLPPDDHVLTPYVVLSGAHGITHAAIMGRKEWFHRNPYDPSDDRAQDYKLWIRARRKDDLSVGFIREPLYYYREEGSMTPQKMLIAKSIGREVVAANGPQMVGSLATAFLLVRSGLKSAVIRFSAMLGGTKHIVRARSPVADRQAFDMIHADIARMRNLVIPVGTLEAT
jgi:glycosyltransferase involved in cell wall biosynthesis